MLFCVCTLVRLFGVLFVCCDCLGLMGFSPCINYMDLLFIVVYVDLGLLSVFTCVKTIVLVFGFWFSSFWDLLCCFEFCVCDLILLFT